MHLKRVLTFLLLFFGFQLASTPGQQVVATWTDTTGNWSDPTNWSTLTVPNNGGGTTYSVTINGASSDVTMDVINATIDNLTLDVGGHLGVAGFAPAFPSLSLVSGASTNNGGIGIAGGSAFVVNSGASLTNNGTMGTAEGEIINNSGAHTTNNGSIDIADDGAALANSGVFNNNSGITLEFHAALSNAAGGLFTNSGTITGDASGLGNAGTFNNAGTITFSTISDPGGISNFGTFNNDGTINLSKGLFNGGFANFSSLRISSTGLFNTDFDYIQTAGSTMVDGKLTASSGAIVNIQGGTLGGTGTINGNVLMAGTMAPGDAPGTLTIIGDYEQASTGFFEEQMSPFSHAFLDVSGNVVLDPGALLEISLLDGFNPLGLTFSIMDFSSLSGQFANGASFWDDNFLWDITYRQHEIDVTAVQAPEPSSFLLLAIGSLTIGALAKRKQATE